MIKIGLEVHAQLATTTKLFCGCPTQGSDEPNSRVCPVCLGHPGTRPVLNRRALEQALALCVALGCRLAPQAVFSRKSYFYPDMSKNYQITQFEEPLGSDGSLRLRSGQRIRIQRVHLEEDPAALSYPQSMAASSYVRIDYNRAGCPLVEIVTEPDFAHPSEAREFLNELGRILAYLGVQDTEHILKADANVSVEETGYTRVEIKNISGFKDVEQALSYEIVRQRTLAQRGMDVVRETRGWDGGATFGMRSKETAEDYGYIVEPDLPVVPIGRELAERVASLVPELGRQKADRYVAQHGIDPTDAEVLCAQRELAELFEKVAVAIHPALAARWLRRELLRVLNYRRKALREVDIVPEQLIELLELLGKGSITEQTGQRLMERLVEGPFSPKAYVEEHGLAKLSDTDALRQACRDVIAAHPKAVADYKAGEEKSFHFLLGQIMRLTKGKADPSVAKQVLAEQLR